MNTDSLNKFTVQFFDAIGQNIEAGKLDISDNDFDKMETIAFKLIDAINIATHSTTDEPQENDNIVIGDTVEHKRLYWRGDVIKIENYTLTFQCSTGEHFHDKIDAFKKINKL